ncbi:MAG: S8 family serine peptidase [Pseudomonadota bacterium]
MPTPSDLTIGTAWADDDGDDGDDDDDNGYAGNGGGFGGADTDRGNWSGRRGRASTEPSGGNIFQRFFGPRRAERPRRTRRPARSRRQRPRTVRQPAAPAPPLPDFAPSEIVALGLTEVSVAALTELGYTVLQRHEIGLIDAFVTRLQVPAGTSLEDARIAVEGVPPGSQADFNHFYRPGEAEPCRELWCLAPNLIDWPDPKANDICVADVTIGLIDTGINAEHEALADSGLTLLTTAEEDLRSSSRQHGTAVAAILVGSMKTRSPGLLPGANIIAVDAFHRSNRGDDRSDAYTLVRSLDSLAASGAQIINMSLAGPANLLLQDMVENLNARGVLLVAAAGNAGPRSDPAFPAAYDEVFAVTAIDNGKRVYRRAGRGAHIDFAAPGVEVWTAASVRGARTRTGTSFATPFVTAALAVLRTGRPDIQSYETAKSRLTAVAEDLGEPGFDPVFGHGLVQVNGLCEAGATSARADDY